jgi:hypothetical protein
LEVQLDVNGHGIPSVRSPVLLQLHRSASSFLAIHFQLCLLHHFPAQLLVDWFWRIRSGSLWHDAGHPGPVLLDLWTPLRGWLLLRDATRGTFGLRFSETKTKVSDSEIFHLGRAAD